MDKDIQEIFREKNREILITNLKFDLDKNVNSLLETISNIFELEFSTAIKKIIAILGDSNILDGDKLITKRLNLMKKENYSDIEKLVNHKKESLLKKIEVLKFEENEMNEYYEKVFDTTKLLKEKLKKEFNNVLDKNSDLISKYVLENVSKDKKELTLLRLTDYLENRLYGKLETKIHMEIMLRDNNLINKAKEVYIRYQEITSKTVKK